IVGHVVAHLRVPAECEPMKDVGLPTERGALPRERAAGNDPARAASVDGETIVLVRASLLRGRRRRQRRAPGKEICDVVRPRQPRTDVSHMGRRLARLDDGLTLKRRTPVLRGTVVRSASGAVEERKLAVESLTISILK